MAITYNSNVSEWSLTGYSDADYVNDLDTRRSTTDYVFCMAGGPVTWSSLRQKLVTLCTIESEFVAVSSCVRELVWIRELLKDIGYRCIPPINLYIDNQGTIKLTKNYEFHKRTKHIDVRYHFIREKRENGDLELNFIPSKSQLADILNEIFAAKHLLLIYEMICILPNLLSEKLLTQYVRCLYLHYTSNFALCLFYCIIHQ